MTLDQLITLDAIEKYGSFKAASENLHKTQPSLSVAIKNLEEEIGFKLFDRSDYRPRLTVQGKSFLEKSRQILSQQKELEELSKQLASGVEPEIRIGLDAVCCKPEILTKLRAFFSDQPDTELTIKLGILGETFEKLLNDEVDLIIAPNTIPHQDLKEVKVTKVRMIPVYAPSMANRGISKEELKDHHQIIVRDKAEISKHISFGVLEDGRKRWHIHDNSLKKPLIMSGLGWGGLPEYEVEKEIERGDLFEISNKEIKHTTFTVSLFYKNQFKCGPVFKKLVSMFETSR